MKRDIGVNAADQRVRNRSLVLRSLILNGATSRQELAGTTSLTGASISRISDELIRQGLIRVVEPSATVDRGVGRPASLLGINPDSLRVGSMYIAGRSARVGLHDARGAVIDQAVVDIADPDDAEAVLERLSGEVLALAERHGAEDRLIRIGATVLGGVDDQGVVVVAHPDWHQVPAGEIIARATGRPAVVDRMQHGLAVAETWFGASTGAHSLAVLDVSDGVGAATVVDGNVITGYDHREGQLGHVVMPGLDALCGRCGMRGCLHTAITDVPFADASRALLSVQGSEGGDGVDRATDRSVISHLYEMARRGDEEALALVETRAAYIGLAMAMVTAVVDPEVFVVSGPTVIDGWDLLENPIREHRLKASPLPGEERHSTVELTSFGTDAVLVGTAALALQHYYAAPELPRVAATR